MATYAARRLFSMVENTAGIIAIELLAACQGIDFRRPMKTSQPLETVHVRVRELVASYEVDRPFDEDIAAVRENVLRDPEVLALVEQRIIV